MANLPELDTNLFHVVRGETPLIATALHAGHEVPSGLMGYYAVSEADRLREEDPGTDRLAALAPTHIIAQTSRFVVDLNRPRPKAVYRQPADAWGLEVWRTTPPEEVLKHSFGIYDSFYAYMKALLTEMTRIHGRVALVDCHSYNHRRNGPEAPPLPQEGDPDLDVEIDPVSRQRWAPRIDRLVQELRQVQVAGRALDVRERIRFQPGHFVCWVNEQFPDSVCAVAIEVKKFYMDEWTGSIHEPVLATMRSHFAEILPHLTQH